MGLCASDPRSVFPWNILRGARLPVFIFYNYGFNIWISLYVLAPQLRPYLRIPIRTGKKILFLVLMVSEQGQKSGCLQPRGAEGGTSLTGVHCITGGAGNSCSFMLGVPNARKRKKKNNQILLWTRFQHSGHHPSPFFPTPKTTHLHSHLQACMSACQRRGGCRSHRRSAYLSKKNVLKETPGAEWSSPPITEHGHTELLAGWGKKGF